MPLSSPLRPGDTISIVAPSSAPHKPARLTRGLTALTEAGFKLDWCPSMLRQRGYLAGSDTERAGMLNRAIRDAHSRAIMCVRGGYGVLRILDHIDYVAARQHRKVLIGFSDTTALHLALYHEARWHGLSGPLVVNVAESSPERYRIFLSLLHGQIPDPMDSLGALRPGTTIGPLLGGNLSMVARLVGTPYMPSLQGAILVLEEVNEAPYRIDALFAQLRLSGALRALGGLVLGTFTGWEPKHDRPVLTPQEILADYFRDAAYPVATGLPYGHGSACMALPVGTAARLEVSGDAATLTVLESVFS